MFDISCLFYFSVPLYLGGGLHYILYTYAKKMVVSLHSHEVPGVALFCVTKFPQLRMLPCTEVTGVSFPQY
jgi:hypothetical protein